MTRFESWPLLLATIASAQDNKAPARQPLFNGKSLDGWKVTDFGGEGEVSVEDGQIIMRMGQPLTGITIKTAAKSRPTISRSRCKR